MRFYGNQLSWAIKHLFITLCFKYHSPSFICVSIMLAPVISSLDEIYCTSLLLHFHSPHRSGQTPIPTLINGAFSAINGRSRTPSSERGTPTREIEQKQQQPKEVAMKQSMEKDSKPQRISRRPSFGSNGAEKEVTKDRNDAGATTAQTATTKSSDPTCKSNKAAPVSTTLPTASYYP